jgi:hypothetical protein
MKKNVGLSLLMFAFTVVLLWSCGGKKEDKEVPEPTTQQPAQRGEYLVTIMGCHDCHTPKDVGPTGPVMLTDLLLSGYQSSKPPAPVDPACIKGGWALITMDLTVAAGPWGISYSANLTSDETGIGNWTLENFKRALKEGKFKGLENGRTLLPPMPWSNFVNIQDEDVSAIYEYLMSTKPVSNVVPPPVPPNELAMK